MLRDEVLKLIQKHVQKGTAVTLTVPEDSEFGHYATNVAFSLSKIEKRPPLEIAERLAAELTRTKSAVIREVKAAAPGFINFFLTPKSLHEELQTILKQKKNYGRSKIISPKSKVQLEFVSANPTGPLTLANGRGGFLGDVLANVLEAAGASVEREFYVNDTGNQIFTLGKSLLATGGFVPDEENLYKGEYVSEWAKKHKKDVEKKRREPMDIGEKAAADFLKLIKRALQKEARIKFDRYTSEKKHIHAKGYVKKALALFKKKGVTYEKDGAVWLKTTAEGDDKDRVLVTGGGFPTYFLADAGHYLETKKRGFKTKINILGPDHYGYVARIQAAAKLVGLPKSEVLVTQAVRLIRGGEEVKMSKRKGNFVTFEEVVEEVGADAARFFFLSVSPTSHMDFNLDLAKERSNKNPVYYAQYAYVRAKSVLNKVTSQKLKVTSRPDLSLLSTPADLALIATLARFPEVVADAAGDYAVHRLTKYTSELARAFHNFYEKEHVVGEAPALAAARLALVKGSIVVFENLFRILGISAPERM